MLIAAQGVHAWKPMVLAALVWPAILHLVYGKGTLPSMPSIEGNYLNGAQQHMLCVSITCHPQKCLQKWLFLLPA